MLHFYSVLWKREENSLEVSLNKVTSVFGVKGAAQRTLLLFLGAGCKG